MENGGETFCTISERNKKQLVKWEKLEIEKSF